MGWQHRNRRIIKETGKTVAGSFSLPANHVIDSIYVKNNTANAVTGGIKFGSTSGATDVVVALTVGASALVQVFDAALLLKFFSTSAPQTIFYDAVVAWNNANVDISVLIDEL